MKRLIFLHLFLSLRAGGVLTFGVTGYTGGAVVIKCGYDEKYQQNKKYFCKDSVMLTCGDLIKTDLKDQWVNSGRFSLYDNTTGRFFTVIFRDLTPEDTGIYYCAVDIKLSLDSYRQVDLTIRKDECCVKSLNMSVYEGETLNISCKFPSEIKTKPKYFCKEFNGSECKYSLSTQENQSWVSDEKFFLRDNRGGVLTVSINSFSTSDAGSYWYGVDMGQYEAWITHAQMNLTRKSALCPTELSQTTFPSPSAATATPSPTTVSSSSVVAVTISGAVLFFLTTSTVIIFIIWRSRSYTQRSTSAGITAMGETTAGIQFLSSEPYYEEIEDIRHSVDLDTAQFEDNTLYTQAKFPTAPSDNYAIYSQAQLPTTSTADEALYTMAQLPTTPSDNDALCSLAQPTTTTVYEALYTMAQLPTTPSAGI